VCIVDIDVEGAFDVDGVYVVYIYEDFDGCFVDLLLLIILYEVIVDGCM